VSGHGPAAGAGSPSGERPSGAVRAARICAWTAAVAGLLHGAILGVWAIADIVADPSYDDRALFAALWIALLALAVLPAWAAVFAVTGRPGGLTFFRVFFPLSLPLELLFAVASGAILVDGTDVTPISAVPFGVGLVGGVVHVVTILVTIVATSLPGFRRSTVTWRRPRAAARGRAMLLASAVVGGVALLVTLGGVGTLRIMSSSYTDSGYSTSEDVPMYLLIGTAIGVVIALFELVLVTGALATRRRAKWSARTVTFLVGVVTLFVTAAGTYVVQSIANTLEYDDKNAAVYDTSVVACLVFGAALLAHIVAMLLLAAPSVSAWLAEQGTARS
jgi:hypothetical protein